MGSGFFVEVFLCKRELGLVHHCQTSELIPAIIKTSLCQCVTIATSVGSWEQACAGIALSLMNDGPANGLSLAFITAHTLLSLSHPMQCHVYLVYFQKRCVVVVVCMCVYTFFSCKMFVAIYIYFWPTFKEISSKYSRNRYTTMH